STSTEPPVAGVRMSRSAIRHLLPGRGARAAPGASTRGDRAGRGLCGGSPRHRPRSRPVDGYRIACRARRGRTSHGRREVAPRAARPTALGGPADPDRGAAPRETLRHSEACCTTRRPTATPERGADRVDLSTRAVVTACLAAGVAVAAFFGPLALAAASGALALVVAIGWPRLLDVPVHGGTRVVVAIAGLGAVGATAATHGEPALRHLPVVLALAVVLAF